MRKRIARSLLLLFMLLLTACNQGGTDGTSPLPTMTDGGDIEAPKHNPPMSLPEYPVIDGSSSTVIMHAAIRAYLTDEHFVDSHSQTYAALERLIPGNENPADVVLAVRYYDETIDDAKNRGADLIITPIAKEGFVFIVHNDNPIDSLTQQQLRDIFSGKITNWKELGGKDERIIPVHRNWNSGSQTAMEDFMGAVPLTDMKEDDSIKLALSMGGMIETVWTTGTGAIGYNIYSWSAGQGMGFGLENVKFLTVDGVEPSVKTLSDSSYPLLVYTYSYYNNSNDKGKALSDWLLTAEGQSVITIAGYVGIFGDYSTDEMPNFYKDEYDSMAKTEEYYTEKGMFDPYYGKTDGYQLLYSEHLPDRKQTEELAAGKGKAVTVLRLVHFMDMRGGDVYHIRFIVLTREKGGVFEVIKEGEVLSHEDGMITSWR